MRRLPRLVAHDLDAQTATAARLLAAERAGVRLLFSHDRHPLGVDLLARGAAPDAGDRRDPHDPHEPRDPSESPDPPDPHDRRGAE